MPTDRRRYLAEHGDELVALPQLALQAGQPMSV
jgi:hypothetical protein